MEKSFWNMFQEEFGMDNHDVSTLKYEYPTEYVKWLEDKLSKKEFAYKDVDDFEECVGYPVNEAFKMGWDMARTTKYMLNCLAGNVAMDGGERKESRE